MSLAVQIALSATAGMFVTALFAALRRDSSFQRQDWFWAAISTLFFGTMAFDMLHSGAPREGATIRTGAMLVLALVAVPYMLRELLANWRDDDKIADLYGAQQGYIVRPERLSPRTKAVLYVILVCGTLAAVSTFYIRTLFSPE